MAREADPLTDAHESTGTDRLDSWKEIAAFLQRDVRTVQRWEKLAGLPVHRHAESRLRTAYAYRSELEAWWRSQRNTVEPNLAAEEKSAAPTPVAVKVEAWFRRRRLLVMGIVGVVAGLLVTAAAFFWPEAPGAPMGTAVSPVPVLLTKFEDQAGRPQFATALEEAVGRELSRSGQVEAVAPTRIARALRLMRRDPTTVLTEAIGREVAAREGRIRFVIAGRIHTVESQYFVDIRAIDSADGRVRVSLEWQGATFEQLLARTEEQSRRLANLVAETAAKDPEPAQPLEPVTSSSTAAVGLYTAAVQAAFRRQWGASELLARRATAADEQFASAHAWTGWAMRHQGRPARECLPSLERAVALSNDITNRETYLISGMLNSVAGHLPASASALEAVLRLHPRDRQALDLLIDVFWRTGRAKRATDLTVARAEFFPDDFYANVRAAHALTMGKRHTTRAAEFAARAQKLASSQTLADRPVWHAWLQVLPIFDQWIAGDNKGALESIAALDASLGGRLGRERDAFSAAVGFANLAFGRTQQAERAFRNGSSPERQINLALSALARDDEESAREWLQQVREHSALRPALFARVGLVEEAERGLDAALPSEHAEGIAAVTRGLLAARRRQANDATPALRQGAQLLRSTGESEFFLGIDALVGMARARGDAGSATRLLFEAAAERTHTYGVSHWSGGYWTNLNANLVEILRHQQRNEDAERISDGLRNVLRDADADWPAASILRSPAGR